MKLIGPHVYNGGGTAAGVVDQGIIDETRTAAQVQGKGLVQVEIAVHIGRIRLL